MLTCDTLFGGNLAVYQDKDGYRFSLDAVLLAGLTNVKPSDRIADLGTGCGVIPLIFAYRRSGEKIFGLEIQPELAALSRKNVDVNGFSGKIEILEMDFRQTPGQLAPETFDLVVSNPPYRRLETGRINPNRQRALARHELSASIDDVFKVGKYLLPHGGRLATIYPAARLAHLLVSAQQNGFSPKQLTMIFSNRSDTARLVHLECHKGGGEELRVAPPFFIYREDGAYTEPMRMFYT